MRRFPMNVMLAANGYPRTAIPVERTSDYMGALEATSVRQEIKGTEELIRPAASLSIAELRDAESALDGRRCAVL